MKVSVHIQRSLLGLIFVITGLNGLFRFLHERSLSTPAARELMTVMQGTPFGHTLFGLQIVCGLLLLARWFVPIALTVLAGFLFNIWMFHLFLDRAFSPLSLLATALWALTFTRNRDAFRTFLRPRLLQSQIVPDGQG